MKAFLSIIVLLILPFNLMANSHTDNQALLIALENPDLSEMESCDTTFKHLGYHLRLIMHDSEIEHIGLNLFNDDLKASIDKEMLDFVEATLLAKILDVELTTNSDFIFYNGGIESLRKVSTETPCKISNLNSRFLSFEWELNPAKTLRLDVPVSYQSFHEGNRSEIEDKLINKIKGSKLIRVPNEESSRIQRQPYGEDLYVLPGSTYLNPEINRNIYILHDSIIQPVWSIDYPAESISNLFLFPSKKYGSNDIEITVLKHEYGEKETFNTNIENLLAECEKDGCIPYWGLESYDGNTLFGSLFLYNWKHGYDHVLKIECCPSDIIDGNGTIRARASLFIPTNNIDTLYEPYREKSDEEKIKYWED